MEIVGRVELQVDERGGEEDADACALAESGAAQAVSGAEDGPGVEEHPQPGGPEAQRRVHREAQLGRGGRQAVVGAMSEPMPAHRRAAAEDGPGPRRKRAARPLVLRPQREHRLPEQPHEPAHVGVRPGDDAAPAAPVEPAPARVHGHRIAREGGGPPRIDRDADAPGRRRFGERAEAHVHPLDPRRRPQRTRDPALGLGPCRHPPIRLAVVLVLLPRRRGPAPQGVQRAGLEPLLEGQAGLPRAAPGQRRRQAAPRAERVDEAEPRAVGESVPLDAL